MTTFKHIILSAVYTLSKKLIMVKHLPAIQENWVRSLVWEDSLEKEMAPHSSILAWRIPWTEELVATVHGIAKSQTQLRTNTHTRRQRGKGDVDQAEIWGEKSRKQESTWRLG